MKNLSDKELFELANQVMNTQEDATEVIQELINRNLPIPGLGY